MNGAFRFRLTGPGGRTIPIQASIDLTNWVDLTNVIMTSEAGEFENPSAAGDSRRFFRAVVP